MSREAVKSARTRSRNVAAKPMSDSGYGLAGQDFVRAVSKMKSVEITVQALRRIRGEKPPGTPMSTWFFGQNINELIEQEEMYLNLLRLRAINIGDVLEIEKLRRQLKDISEEGRLAEDRSKYECWQDETVPGANSRQMNAPWTIGEGCWFDRFHMLGFKRDASTLHLRVHWIAKQIKHIEIVLDQMGEAAPEVLRDTVEDGRCLTWLLITDRGGMEEIIVSICSRDANSDSSETSEKSKIIG